MAFEVSSIYKRCHDFRVPHIIGAPLYCVPLRILYKASQDISPTT